MFRYSCGKHWVCRSCAEQSLDGDINLGRAPRCPLFSVCGLEQLTSKEIKDLCSSVAGKEATVTAAIAGFKSDTAGVSNQQPPTYRPWTVGEIVLASVHVQFRSDAKVAPRVEQKEEEAVEMVDLSRTSGTANSAPTPGLLGGGGSWTCQACTFVNGQFGYHCEVCLTPNPRVRPITPPLQAKGAQKQKRSGTTTPETTMAGQPQDAARPVLKRTKHTKFQPIRTSIDDVVPAAAGMLDEHMPPLIDVDGSDNAPPPRPPPLPSLDDLATRSWAQARKQHGPSTIPLAAIAIQRGRTTHADVHEVIFGAVIPRLQSIVESDGLATLFSRVHKVSIYMEPSTTARAATTAVPGPPPGPPPAASTEGALLGGAVEPVSVIDIAAVENVLADVPAASGAASAAADGTDAGGDRSSRSENSGPVTWDRGNLPQNPHEPLVEVAGKVFVEIVFDISSDHEPSTSQTQTPVGGSQSEIVKSGHLVHERPASSPQSQSKTQPNSKDAPCRALNKKLSIRNPTYAPSQTLDPLVVRGQRL